MPAADPDPAGDVPSTAGAGGAPSAADAAPSAAGAAPRPMGGSSSSTGAALRAAGATPSSAGDPLTLLLAGQYPDPETGELLAAAARSVVIEDSLDGREVELVAALGVGHRLALVADVDTYDALGRRVERAL